MIDFACKQFKLDEVIKCALGLTKADFSVLEYFMEHAEDWQTTDMVAEKLDLNLSTVQRSVKKLHEKDVLQRTQQNLDGGGYIFQYKLFSKKHIRSLIMGIVDKWKSTVENSLNKW